MTNGFFRVAACSPAVEVAGVADNVRNIKEIMQKCADEGCDLAVFPEMCVTAYTCGDLFHNRTLLDAAAAALLDLAMHTACTLPVIVGAPVEVDGTLYNCAVVLAEGRLAAIVPKTYLPNYNEFYEKRWWSAAPCGVRQIHYPSLPGKEWFDVPFGTDILIEIGGVKVSVEICEDMWTPVPPSCLSCMAGADVAVNLSASDDLIGKYAYVHSLVSQQSARCICGYVYASAGYGESSTDLVFDGKTLIYENGRMLASNTRWVAGNQYVAADIDIEAIRRDRMHFGSYADCGRRNGVAPSRYVTVPISHEPWPATRNSLMRIVDPTPFVPPTDEAMHMRCDEITNIQAAGLARRLEFIHCSKLVVGISGGLDSTLALLVAVKAFDRLGLDRKDIIGVTMPGFGTTRRTKGNAFAMMERLGVTIREIPIDKAVRQHFADIGHDESVQDVTYENCQARERTQILMDIANQTGGIVLGTGDLSELALGWATYNGDHMSMYGVNAGVPKTLVKYLVRHFAMSRGYEDCRDVLLDIIDTPVSPELIPADEHGNIKQKTEDIVGPYELHDFFLYYTLRYGFSPERIMMLACEAFAGEYDKPVIERWEKEFFRRFFQQQFKRSCLPDGPKVGSVCLSPRGDWRMPSDASSALWRDIHDV